MRIACIAGALIKEYQTLVVGALGFTGVILTLIMNARLNREQHTRQIEHERTGLKAALSTELSIISDTFRDRIEMIGDPPVLRAYLLIQAVPDRLRLMQGMHEIQPGARYLWIESNQARAVRRMHENFLGDIEKAIAALQ